MQSLRNSPVEDYNEIFNAVYKRNVPFIRCKTGLRRSTSAGVDAMNLFLTDLSALRLISCLYRAEAAL
jgi:hypothetical protein